MTLLALNTKTDPLFFSMTHNFQKNHEETQYYFNKFITLIFSKMSFYFPLVKSKKSSYDRI